MLNLWLPLVRGDDKPDLIVSSWDYYAFFEQSQSSPQALHQRRCQRRRAGGLRVDEVQDRRRDVRRRFGHPDAHMYFLNTDYLELVVHRDANMTEVPELRSVNQDAVVMPIIWQGNLVTSNRSLQGVLKRSRRFPVRAGHDAALCARFGRRRCRSVLGWWRVHLPQEQRHDPLRLAGDVGSVASRNAGAEHGQPGVQRGNRDDACGCQYVFLGRGQGGSGAGAGDRNGNGGRNDRHRHVSRQGVAARSSRASKSSTRSR
jgi:hypothetical protein